MLQINNKIMTQFIILKIMFSHGHSCYGSQQQPCKKNIQSVPLLRYDNNNNNLLNLLIKVKLFGKSVSQLLNFSSFLLLKVCLCFQISAALFQKIYCFL